VIGLAVVFAGLAVLALAVVVVPLLRTRPAPPGRGRYDAAVYRDQLAELDRDRARGLIGEAEAGVARLEIERRLLGAEAAAPAAGPPRRHPALAVALALLVAGGAAGLYLRLGAPGVADTEFALRVAARGAPGGAEANHPDMAKMASALAEKLRANPDNREGWQLYARTLATMGNWAGAAEAWHRLIALGDAPPDAYAALGEMLVLEARGTVTPAAREAFGGALRAEPGNQIARFYLALADAEAGRGRQAIDAWVKLAGETSDGEMRAEIARRIAETARLSGLAAPALPAGPAEEARAEAARPAAPGPDQDQLAAAANMPAADRDTMVRGMVDQLAAKLAANPGDADGWMRLGRAYAVLAEHDKAADAYERAAALRPGDVAPLIQGVQALIEAQKPDAPIPRRAVGLLRQAGRIAPDQPEVLWYLGLAEAQAGHLDTALDDWNRLLGLLPRDSPEYKMVTDAIAEARKQ
jgi:cytochrome c-type biogenesis protein CcmH